MASKIVDCICQPHKVQHDVAAIVVQAFPQAGHAERLARCAADEQLDLLQQFLGPGLPLGDVAQIRDIRVVVRENGAGKRLNLAEGYRRPAERVPGHGGGFDAGADGEVFHSAPSSSLRLNTAATSSRVLTTAWHSAGMAAYVFAPTSTT